MFNHIGQVDIIRSTPLPQNISALVMHNDYSEKYVLDEPWWLNLGEKEAGNLVVERCLKYGHWSVLESCYFSFGVKGAPHSVMQQLRTHRHLAFQVQSFRYSGKRFDDWYNKYSTDLLGKKSYKEIKQLFYVREPGIYADRQGNRVDWSEADQIQAYGDLINYLAKVIHSCRIKRKMPYEMFRDFLPAGYRQNFVVSGNLRAFLHLFDMRLPKDAQLECQVIVQQIANLLESLCPEIMKFYNKKRAGKNKLAP